MIESCRLIAAKENRRKHEPAMLKAPFPWFGGKSKVAPIVWERFGKVANYVEPFFGSGAVLLGRPQTFSGIETVNDKDGFVANFWRALQQEPESVAKYADQPVNENDLHARHIWLVSQKESLVARLEGDPEFYDSKIAGWWVWGICCWIGSGFCSGKGPWGTVETEDGAWQLVHLRNAGRGVNRQLVHLRNAGMGVNRQLVNRNSGGLYGWMQDLAERLRYVRVCCGDWSRICGPSPTYTQGLTGVFLDPSYSGDTGRTPDIYAVDDLRVAPLARGWAIQNGQNPLLRIALCGYKPMEMPPGWSAVNWSSKGGYGVGRGGTGEKNRHREVVWFSPFCIVPHREPVRFDGG